MDSAAPINARQVKQFQRDGAVCLRQVFGRHWLDLVAAGIKRNLDSPNPYAELLKDEDDAGIFFGDYCNWRRIPEFRAYVQDSPAAHLEDFAPHHGWPGPW